MNNNLPFERGATYFDGDTNRIGTASALDDILGQTFTVKNNGQGGVGHNSQENTLMVVRNASGGDLIAGRGVEYANNIGNEATGYARAGKFGHIIDDAYGDTVIVSNDLFYVILNGPVQAKADTAATFATGEAAVFGAVGRITGLSTANDHVVGVFFDTIGSPVQDAPAIVGAGGRYANAGPAVP